GLLRLPVAGQLKFVPPVSRRVAHRHPAHARRRRALYFSSSRATPRQRNNATGRTARLVSRQASRAHAIASRSRAFRPDTGDPRIATPGTDEYILPRSHRLTARCAKGGKSKLVPAETERAQRVAHQRPRSLPSARSMSPMTAKPAATANTACARAL